MSPHQVLKKYWHYDTFRPLQEDIITAVLDDKDVLALLPTGGGKSICFQVPAVVRDGICVVVSPLIALMQDQVYQLKKRGIQAELIFAGMSRREIDIILDNCVYGKIKFLYVSPERLQTEIFQERVVKMNVNLLAIDEAHCISQWGYDFRPPYLQITELRKIIPKVNTIALTATATEMVKQDIIDKLALKNVALFRKSFMRENLAYVVKRAENKLGRLLNILNKISGTAIVYANTRKRTKEIAEFLAHHKISVTHYNAGLDTAERNKRQNAWIKGQVRVMVATNAFGMGIDKANVRLVVHMDLPATLESYYQESGRAGRDELNSYAVLFYEENDVSTLRENLEIANPSIDQLKIIYQHIANYYSVAIGSHSMITYDFDIYDFCEKYGLKPSTVYPVIRALEQQNIIQVSENFFERSKINCDISTKDLYTFQIENAHYDLLIKAILRTYGGDVFSSFVNISETKIASLLGYNLEKVISMLMQLQKLEIFNYVPQKDTPQLTFTVARTSATDMPIDNKFLQKRYEIATQKCEYMIEYATHQYRCRQQILLEYFGEISYEKCTKCDICLAKKKQLAQNDSYCMYKHIVLDRLKTSPCSVEDLVDFLSLDAEEDTTNLLQIMLHYEEIKFNKEGLLELCPPL